jgi:hypothetical protein
MAEDRRKSRRVMSERTNTSVKASEDGKTGKIDILIFLVSC